MKIALCKICRQKVEIKGYLHICKNDECNALYWSKNLFKILKEGKKFYNLIDDEKNNLKKKN